MTLQQVYDRAAVARSNAYPLTAAFNDVQAVRLYHDVITPGSTTTNGKTRIDNIMPTEGCRVRGDLLDMILSTYKVFASQGNFNAMGDWPFANAIIDVEWLSRTLVEGNIVLGGVTLPYATLGIEGLYQASLSYETRLRSIQLEARRLDALEGLVSYDSNGTATRVSNTWRQEQFWLDYSAEITLTMIMTSGKRPGSAVSLLS